MGTVKHDEGFTVIEAAVAVSLLAFLVAALGVVIAMTARAVGERRLEQDAAVLASEMLEEARDLDYVNLVHDSADATLPAGLSVDPDGPGPVGTEQLIFGSCGVNPAVFARTENGATFTVIRLVTWVDTDTSDSEVEDHKRLSVAVTWTSRGIAREHRAEALVSELGTLGSAPGVNFDLSPDNASIVGIQEEELAVGFTITNSGPDNKFNLLADEPTGASYVVAFHRDLNGNGVKDAGDSLLLDTNGDLKVDTGVVAMGSSFDLLAVWTPTTSDPAGYSAIGITAEAIDTADTDGSTIDMTLNAAAASGSFFYLHNRLTPPSGDTSTQKDLDMDSTAPTGSTLYNYSTNKDSDQGRYVGKDGAVSTTNSEKMVNWVWEIPATTTYSGSAQVTLWIAMKDFTNDKNAGVRVLLRHKGSKTTGSGTSFGDVTQTHNGTGGWEQMTFDVPVNTTIAGGQWLELKVIVTSGSDDPIYVAFDTTSYPSSLDMP